MFELLLPVALGMLGGGIGLAFAGRMRQNRQAALEEADALQSRGELRAAASCLERALKNATPTEKVFIAEAQYRLCGLYTALGQWHLGESVCRELLGSGSELGPSGQHDVLRHLARCLEGQSQRVEAEAARAQADSLIEQIPDTAYRLFARQERLVRQREFREALPLQEELLASYSERISVATLLCFTAFTAQHAGYPRDAEGYATRALAHPELSTRLRWQAHRVSYHAAETQSDWPALLRHARQMQALAPGSLSRSYLATALLLNGSLEEAEALLTHSQDVSPDIGLRVTLARLRGDLTCARRLLEKAATGSKTALLQAAVELEAGDGGAALVVLDNLLEPSSLRSARRVWALALLGVSEAPPDHGNNPEVLEACAQAHWHQGALDRALATQEALLKLPLAPAFRNYHEAILKRWKTAL